MHTYDIHCLFINGSDARGCQVVLVSEHAGIENVTEDFTRSNTLYNLFVQEKLNISSPVSCYQKLLGFDIEINYTIGDLAIEGNLTSHVGGLCRSSESKGLWIYIKHMTLYCCIIYTYADYSITAAIAISVGTILSFLLIAFVATVFVALLVWQKRLYPLLTY